VRTSEKSVYFNVTTQRCIPESCRTHIGISWESSFLLNKDSSPWG
jgi:hypothetical protein